MTVVKTPQRATKKLIIKGQLSETRQKIGMFDLCLPLHLVVLRVCLFTMFQINFLVCQLFALVVGLFYREYLGPHRASPVSRHLIQIAIGIPLTYFCFGRSATH